MSNISPFYLYKRKSSPYWSVRYKLEDGFYTSAKSTKQKDRKQAEKVAVQWLITGEYKLTAEQSKKKMLKDFIRKSDIDDEDLMYVVDELKRRKVVSKVIIRKEPEAVNALEFARNFWTWDKSPYIAEKLRQGHSIHLTHAINMEKFINKYWASEIENKCLGEITRADIEKMIVRLSTENVATHSRNAILRSFTTALRWAANHDIIEKDITQGIAFFSVHYNEREILTPELAHAVFSIEWDDNRAKLANIVAMLTGMRCGEIRALQLKDLGDGCIYVRHSWNDFEGLKCPKNGEERIVQFPFPEIMEEMKNLYWSNPFATGLEEFIFWATVPHQPVDGKTFREALKRELLKIGLEPDTVKKYTFHAWRHFFTTYMSDKCNTKLLQMQTGHKTREMLEHYAAHRTALDVENIRKAQKELFAPLLE